MKIKTLNNGAFLLFVLIIGGLLFNAVFSKDYGRSNAAILEAAMEEDFFISYGELETLLFAANMDHNGQAVPKGTETGSAQVFIDLRDPEAFARGHVPGALNVPAREILDRKHRKVFKRDVPKLLYAEEEHVAATAAMLLLGKGVEEVRVVPGSIRHLEEHLLQAGRLDPAYRFFRDDKARFDYPKYMKAGVQEQQEQSTTPAIPEMQRIAVQGGC
jgi:rhodanese-related sulfurtransferase